MFSNIYGAIWHMLCWCTVKPTKTPPQKRNKYIHKQSINSMGYVQAIIRTCQYFRLVKMAKTLLKRSIFFLHTTKTCANILIASAKPLFCPQLTFLTEKIVNFVICHSRKKMGGGRNHWMCFFPREYSQCWHWRWYITELFHSLQITPCFFSGDNILFHVIRRNFFRQTYL